MRTVNDARTAFAMVWQLAWISFAFERRPLGDLFARWARGPKKYAHKWTEAERIKALSETVVYRMPNFGMGNCLKLSLLRFIHLRRRGFNVRFHMGVKPTAEGVTGHAWLTLNGEPLWEKDEFLKGFKETYSYPPLAD